MDRCYCAECEKLDRKRYQGIPGTFQARLFAGSHRHQAAPVEEIEPAPPPIDVGALPLFAGSLEPDLFA
jgi:hypothetical protein